VENRPRSVIEILDASLLLLRHRWLSFYACASLGTVPLILLGLVYFHWLGTLVESTDPALFRRWTLWWALAMTAAWGVYGLARAAVAQMALAGARGVWLTPAEALARSWRQGWSASVVGMASFALVGLAGLLFLVPGLLLALAWWVAVPALLEEKQAPLAALGRSVALTAGHRGRAFHLWLAFLAVWTLALLNLYLLSRGAVETFGSAAGLDSSRMLHEMQPANFGFAAVLVATAFFLLAPLKSVADALYYLDLRVRREGADLQERLRRLRAGAPVVGLALLFFGAPASALDLAEYQRQVGSLRRQVEAAKSPEDVRWSEVERLRDQLVESPDQPPVRVRNEWLLGWESDEEKATLLHSLEALERSLGTTGGSGDRPDVDPANLLAEVLQEPQFQRLAERPELSEFVSRLRFEGGQGWWAGFRAWVEKTIFAPLNLGLRRPDVQVPPHLGRILTGLLVFTMLVLLVLGVRKALSQPRFTVEAHTARRSRPVLTASATENALDHSVDEWEEFAQEWLRHGDVRQAVRALYLASLVHLHRERLIDYNRALTNWVYVRHFRGEPEQKQILAGITGAFDEVWYGERPCPPERYAAIEEGVRALGTPAPVGGGFSG
jgi:hypothetical protein